MPGNWERSPTSGTQRTAAPGWRKLRLAVLERDGHRCRLRIAGICAGTADQVDHIIGHAEGGTSAESNLRAVCGPCHRYHTSRQANAAQQGKRPTSKRPPERHPGLRW